MSRSDSGTSPLTMRSASPSTIAVLPTPGSPISTGLFLVRRDSTWIVRRISSSRPMTGSSLPVARGLGEVAGVFLQRVIGVLGARRIGGAALAQIVDRGVERLRRDAGVGEDLAGLRALLHRQRQQQPLDGDEGIARLLGDLLGVVEHARRRRREIELAGARALHFRQFGERQLDLPQAPRANCRPPCRSGRPHRPSSSSSSTFRRCSGVNCWWPSRSASDCALWTKPRARSVYFSRIHGLSLFWRRLPPRSDVERPDDGFAALAAWPQCRSAPAPAEGAAARKPKFRSLRIGGVRRASPA